MTRRQRIEEAHAQWPFLQPLVERVVRAGGGAAAAVAGSLTVHNLNDTSVHLGVLDDAQAPQFLMADGSRNLTGNLGVSAGVTIDGVDLSAHVLDPNAHHWAVDGGDGILVGGIHGQTVSAKSANAGISVSSVGIGAVPGDGIDILAGIQVDVTDIIDTLAGLQEDASNNIQVKLSAPAGLDFGGAGGLQVADTIAGAGLVIANKVLDVGVSGLGLSTDANAVILTSSSNPGAAASILASATDGSLRLDSDTLFIDATNDAVWINSGAPDGSSAFKVKSSFPSDVTQLLQQISGQTARIWQVKNVAGQELIVLDSVGNLQSGNPGFVSGLTGWQISHTGNAEFNNGWFRGELHASVFVLDEFHVSGGTLFVANGGTLLNDALIDSSTGAPDLVTIRTTSVTGSGTIIDIRTTSVTGSGTQITSRVIANYLDIKDPASAHAIVLDTSDIVRLKTWNGSGLYDQWFRVNYAEDLTTHFRYWVQKVSATLDGAIPAGTAWVDYGQAGDGRILLTSDQNYAPYMDVFTIGASPWDGEAGSIVPHVRIGRLDGVGLPGISGIEQYGIVSGTDLSNANSAHIVASNLQMKLFKVDLTLHDGLNPTVSMTSDGHVKFGVDVENPLLTGFFFDRTTGNVQIGQVAGNYLEWDQASGTLEVKGQINIQNPGDISLDAIADGSTYKKTTASEKTGAGRAFSGLDANNALVTKVLPGSNVGTPAGSGLYLGADKMGFYNGSVWRTYMDNTGKFYFAGATGATLAWDGTDLYGTDGSVVQWYARASSGKLFAGGGNVTLDANGVYILSAAESSPTYVGTDGFYSNSRGYRLTQAGTTYAMLYGRRNNMPNPDRYEVDLWCNTADGALSYLTRIGAGPELVGTNYTAQARLELSYVGSPLGNSALLEGIDTTIFGGNNLLLGTNTAGTPKGILTINTTDLRFTSATVSAAALGAYAGKMTVVINGTTRVIPYYAS